MTNDDLRHEPADLSFHDDSIYGFRLISPEPDRDDWRSELILDIDHILEWIKGDDGHFRFLLVQANLCFENVSDLRVSFSFPEFSLNPLPIDRIDRNLGPVKMRGDKYQEFSWTIHLNDRAGGSLTFRSTAYRLEQIGKPTEFGEQTIPNHRRI